MDWFFVWLSSERIPLETDVRGFRNPGWQKIINWRFPSFPPFRDEEPDKRGG